MSPAEVLFRVREYFLSRSEFYFRQGWFPKPSLPSYPEYLFDIPPVTSAVYRSHYPIFDRFLDTEQEIDWHLDLQSGRHFPKTYSRKIEIRSEKFGNAKYVWEVNRMQYLPRLALQYKQSKDEAVLDRFCLIISSWREENPYLIGLNWYSNIEVSIRLLNWFICWEILRASDLIEENSKFRSFVEKHWLPLIYLHCHFASRYPSRYSSANNHTIAEASALYVAAAFWQFRQSKKWRDEAKNTLESAICTQHSESGINKEQAAGYIQFVADFLLVAYLVAKKKGDPFSSEYRARFEKIIRYVQTLTEENGIYPRYGDEDDALLFFLDTGDPGKNFLAHCSSAAKLFPENSNKNSHAYYGLKNRLLLGPETEQVQILDNHEFTSHFYPADGHFFFRHEDEQYKISLHFNAASLGLEPMAAHGHADALSFSLTLNGSPVFIDPGTYCYHTELKWRQYFISTIAHNTVCVNNQNQAVNGGPTLWLSRYLVSIDEAAKGPDIDTVLAHHNAYQAFGIIHSRRLTFDKSARLITIDDLLTNEKSRPAFFELPLHLYPQTMIEELDRHRYKITTETHKAVYVSIDLKMQTQIINGETDPILGWYSPAFYRKEACPVIYSTFQSSETTEIKTQIRIGD